MYLKIQAAVQKPLPDYLKKIDSLCIKGGYTNKIHGKRGRLKDPNQQWFEFFFICNLENMFAPRLFPIVYSDIIRNGLLSILIISIAGMHIQRERGEQQCIL
ncbi:hypothetical protein HNO89_002735 [Sporosarcina luteola]|nr:hypothetical protein [Sporosarcina luteola]